MIAKTKLELKWIGKEHRPRLEPRILVEDASRSHHAAKRREGDAFDNILIKGDNLLALKALESDFIGTVECIYIDPPFNTQQAFDHYEDGLDHSVWLSMMRDRVSILHSLLSDTGSFFAHIDDNELAYLMVVCDEIFGRKNRIGVITFKQSSVSGPKVVNPGLVTVANYIMYYAKDKSKWRPGKVYVETARDTRYSTFITNRDAPCEEWTMVPLSQAHRQLGRGQSIDDFVLNNAASVIQLARIDPKDVSADTRASLLRSTDDPNVVYEALREGRENIYFLGGKQVLFYSSKVRLIDGNAISGQALSNIWDDLLSNNIHKEGGVRFPDGKKPEALIKRILELSTREGDLVLDSFAGSGTTGAAAHKLRRRWIMIEGGDQADNHISPRLKAVVDGVDDTGISQAVSWKGGGGYRYFKLAPSLLEKDQFGQWVISKAYNAEMLAEAMCKHFGFVYAPSDEHYWMHGHSSEADFIYVTTNSLTHEQLRAISGEVGGERTLLICCKAFQGANADGLGNLTIRKIPGAILNCCEWGKDDYSLKIEALPLIEDEQEPVTQVEAVSRGRRRQTDDAPSLFDAENEA